LEETPDLNGASPCLGRERVEAVAAYGERRPIEHSPEIEVYLRIEICDLHSHGLLEEVVAGNNRAGGVRRFEVRALFVFVGADPCAGRLSGTVALDDKGHVRTGDPQALPLETALPRVSAGGDMRSGSIKRVASAVGEEAMSVRLASERLSR
jgi:thioredoxin reductase (NADPH)